MWARCRASFVCVAGLASLVAASGVGCASGGRTLGPDTGVRRDAPFPLLDAPPIDAPGTVRPDVGERPDTPIAPGTDTGPSFVRDTGVDAPVAPGTDAGPPPECTTAAECADGNACNGIERCELGMCTPGIAVTCDDGVACTIDGCSAGACTYTPNDAACGSGMRCTSTGCMSTSSCSESPCRLAPPQCGCGAGQACYPMGATRSCATAGSLPEGSACTGTDCAAGLLCVAYDGSAAPPTACNRMCATDADCPGGALCAGTLSSGLVRYCSLNCNPVAQSGCGPGLRCTLDTEATGAMRWYRSCFGGSGTGGEFAGCLSEADCGPGFTCADVGFGGECLHWCNVATGAGCGFLTSCIPGAPAIVVGGVEYGVCG